MTRVRLAKYALTAAVVSGCLAVSVSAQGPRLPMPLEPIGNSEEAIFPAYQGWGQSLDGKSYYIVLGYMNRNRRTTVEIPIGPNNRIEPGGPDMGQPTVFEPGLQKVVFAIQVPKDFGTKKLTWTLVANGQTAAITFYLNPEYNIDFFREEANGNDAPKLKLEQNAPMMVGPTAGIAQTLTGVVGQPVPLQLWASDAPPTEKNWEKIISSRQQRGTPPTPSQVAVIDGRVLGVPRAAAKEVKEADITAVWKKVRGPGKVTMTPPTVPLFTGGDGTKVVQATATATFSEPGEYVLRAEPVEIDDGFDGLCCFTFANVKVVVK